MATVDKQWSAGGDNDSPPGGKLLPAVVPMGRRDSLRVEAQDAQVTVERLCSQQQTRGTSTNSLSSHKDHALSTTLSSSSSQHNSDLDKFSAAHFILDDTTNSDLFGSVASRGRDRIPRLRLWRRRTSEATTSQPSAPPIGNRQTLLQSVNSDRRPSLRKSSHLNGPKPDLKRDLRFASRSTRTQTQSDPHLRLTARRASSSSPLQTTPISFAEYSKPIRHSSAVNLTQSDGLLSAGSVHRSFWILGTYFPEQTRRHSENWSSQMAESKPLGIRPEKPKDGKPNPFQRPLFQDLPTAYSSITSRPGYMKSSPNDGPSTLEEGMAIPSLQSFQFRPHQINQSGNHSVAEKEYSPKDISHEFPVASTTQPSSAQSLPVPNAAGTEEASLNRQRQASNQSETFSYTSLYGDNRDFLNASRNMPSIAFSRSPSGLSGKASSGVLTEDRLDRHRDGGSADSQGTGSMNFNNNAASGDSNNTLESDVARELRRVSRLSGLSNLSASIMLLNESTVHVGNVQSSSPREIGPGSSQTSSSKTPSNESSNEMEVYGLPQETQFTASDIPKMWTNTERVGVARRGNSGKSHPSNTREPDDDIGAYEEDEEDGDWETIAESGALNRMESQRGIARATSGSSLADNSSEGSVGEGRSYSLVGGTGAMVKHPADERYDHVYRIRQTTPNGEPMLFPTYTFEGGLGFPNRNALTPPAPASPGSGKSYQHPVPLSTEHDHPFKSSPPVFMSSGRAMPRAYEDVGTPKFSSHTRSHGVDLARSPPDTLRQFDFGFDASNQGSITGQQQAPTEIESHAFESPYVPSGNGSFSKVTTLGPKKNVTGTPEGTGMREVGSSLADRSSSPYELSSGRANADLVQRPKPAVAHDPRSDPTVIKRSPSWQDSVRRHREHLVAEGLLPRIVTPPGGRPGSLFSSNDSDMFSISPSTYLYAFGRPISFNPTPPLPRNQSQQASEWEYRLRRLPRENASLSPILLRQQRLVSNNLLLVCLVLFPPISFLLYGHGCLDWVMVFKSNGQIEKLAAAHKRVARILAYTLDITLIVGIIVFFVVHFRAK